MFFAPYSRSSLRHAAVRVYVMQPFEFTSTNNETFYYVGHRADGALIGPVSSRYLLCYLEIDCRRATDVLTSDL